MLYLLPVLSCHLPDMPYFRIFLPKTQPIFHSAWHIICHRCQSNVYCSVISSYFYKVNVQIRVEKIKTAIQEVYFIVRKKVGKKWPIFLPVTNFFTNYFFFTDDYRLRTNNFYLRVFLPTFFLQTRTFSIF